MSESNENAAVIRVEIGSKAARGKGYGTKITNAMSEYGFNVLGLHKIKALVLKENLPSYYMFKKCGYVDEGVLVDDNFKNDRYYDVIMMARFEKSGVGQRKAPSQKNEF